MARHVWTRQEAIDFLRGSKFTPSKPLSEYKTEQLQRKASYYKKAEEEGFAPSVQGSRGKHPARIKTKYIPRRETGGRAVVSEQYSLIGSKGRAPTRHRIAQFRKEIETPPKRQRKGEPERHAVVYQKNVISGEDMITGNFTGILCEKYSIYEAGEEGATLGFRMTRSEFEEQYVATNGNLTELARVLFGNTVCWQEVYGINILTGL